MLRTITPFDPPIRPTYPHFKETHLNGNAAVRITSALTASAGANHRRPAHRESRRTITLPPLAVEALRVHKGRQNKEKLPAGRYWQETGLVFTSTVGSPPRCLGRV